MFAEGPLPEGTVERPRLNRFAVASLIAGACLLFPLGALFGVIAVVQIRRSGRREEGLILAGLGLVLSVVILPLAGVLLFTADPAVFNSCRELQHQAEGTLRVVRFLEQDFRDREGRYGTLDEIGFKSMYGDTPYRYALAALTDTGFHATATGNGDMEGDLLEVKNGGKVTRVVDVCHGQGRPRP